MSGFLVSSVLRYWISTSFDLKANTSISPVNSEELIFSLGSRDWWHYDNLSHIWWMLGITDCAAGDIFIRLRLTGPNDEKNIPAFAWREHFADFSREGGEDRQERGNHHLYVTASFLLAREYAGNADSDDWDVILDRNGRGFDISNSS